MEAKLKEKMFEIILMEKKKIFFELKHKFAKPIISFSLIINDLDEIINCIQKAESLMTIKNIDNLLISSLWQKVTMSYGRIFGSSNDGYSTLHHNDYLKTKRDLKLHKELIEIRNGYIAHRGENKLESSVLLVFVNHNDNKFSFEFEFPIAQLQGHYFRNCQELKKFIIKLRRKVELTLQKKIKKINRALWTGLLEEKKGLGYFFEGY